MEGGGKSLELENKLGQHEILIGQCKFIQVTCFLYIFNCLQAQKRVWHVNLGICMNALTEIQSAQKWHSVQSYRGEIQPSSMMASVCVCNESNQREYKAALFLMAAHRLPEAHPFQKIPKEQLGAPCEHVWRADPMNKCALLSVYMCSTIIANMYVSLWKILIVFFFFNLLEITL